MYLLVVCLGSSSGPDPLVPKKNGGKTLGDGGPIIINPIYTLYSVYLLGIYWVYCNDLSHERYPDCLGYIGDYTTQLCRHYNNKPI